MTPNKININLQDDTLSERNLKKVKWSTTIAIIGLPIVVQILGAMIFFSEQFPVLLSMPALIAFAIASIIVLGAGIYAITNRIFLRFSGANKGLEEWETTTQTDAFAFAYRMIAKGALLAFVGISVMGSLQFSNLMGWIDFDLMQSIAVGTEGLAAVTIVLTYLILLLPTLYIAWTLKPLSVEESENR